MKLVTQEFLLGGNPKEWPEPIGKAFTQISQAIKAVVWPVDSNRFRINPTFMGNGVKPIKDGFVSHLGTKGWELEVRASITAESSPGKIDAIKRLADGSIIAVEWETGNISSSHRAMNKMVVGMLNKRVAAGFLILPERTLYKYLTDRIGNVQELRPYFQMWKCMPIEGVLCVLGVEHDSTSEKVPCIPKGFDGLSIGGRQRNVR